jgi:hypothetical protein
MLQNDKQYKYWTQIHFIMWYKVGGTLFDNSIYDIFFSIAINSTLYYIYIFM